MHCSGQTACAAWASQHTLLMNISHGTIPLHVSSIQGPYSISQGLVWVSRDLFILIGLHLLKQPCQVLLADLQLGPLTCEQKTSSEIYHHSASHLSPPFPDRGSQDHRIFVMQKESSKSLSTAKPRCDTQQVLSQRWVVVIEENKSRFGFS